MGSGLFSAIDPLAPAVHGRYEDDLVIVEPTRTSRGASHPRPVQTPHFDLTPTNGRIRVEHSLQEDEVDDDLAGMLHDELFGPGWLRGPELFERVFTGVVRSLRDDPLESWEVFYRNTQRRLERPSPGAGRPGSIDAYRPVHDHALDLLPRGTVLELGCCFGFLSLAIARTGRPVTAADVSGPTIVLLDRMAERLGVRVETVVADASRFPGDDASVDTVLAISLLEHLEPQHGTQVVAEAVRLAARRVVVAVPLEDEANETYGHVRTVSLDDLDGWGRGSGCRYDVHELHGGWLVIDKPR